MFLSADKRPPGTTSSAKSSFLVLITAAATACSSSYMEDVYIEDPSLRDSATLTWSGPERGGSDELLFEAYLIDGQTMRCGDYYCSDEMKAKRSVKIAPGLHCVHLKSHSVLPTLRNYWINFPMRFDPGGRYNIELVFPERSAAVTDHEGQPIFEATFRYYTFKDPGIEATHHQPEFAFHRFEARGRGFVEENSRLPDCPILLNHR